MTEPKNENSRKRASSATPRRDTRTNTWSFVVENGTDPATGKRKQIRRRGFPTRKAAETELTRVRGQLQNGNYIAPERTTVGSFLTHDWLPAIRSTVEPSTLESYERNLRLHVIPNIGQIALQHVEPQHLNALYGQLLANGRRDGKGGLKPRTVRYIHTIVHRAFRDAARWGKTTRNIADLADPPSPKSARAPEMKVWTPEQLHAFLDYLDDTHDRLATPIRLGALAGLRRGEVLGLTWEDINLDTGTITVRRQLRTVRGKMEHVAITKTSAGRRQVTIDAGTIAALRTTRAQQATERLALGTEYPPSNLVFTHRNGTPIHPNPFTMAFAKRVKACGLPKIRLHDLRHTHVAHLIAAGTHVKVVSERIGHTSTSFTMDQYGHLMDGQQGDAAEAVARLVDGAAD